MESTDLINLLSNLDKKLTEKDINDPWLVYVSEKGNNCCQQCLKNHGKRFRTFDLSRPALPIHPNCKCKYEKLDIRTAKRVALQSETVRVENSPGIGGTRISGIDDMLDKLEKHHIPNSLSELIISNHGGIPGRFPMGNNDDLVYLSSFQIKRLKKLLSPNAIIDIRMCYSANSPIGNKSAQKLANILRCKIRGYEGPVSPYGTRPNFIKPDSEHKNNYFQRILPNHKPKIFLPE